MFEKLKFFIIFAIIPIMGCFSKGNATYYEDLAVSMRDSLGTDSSTVDTLAIGKRVGNRKFTIFPASMGEVECPKYTVTCVFTVQNDSIVKYTMTTSCAETPVKTKKKVRIIKSGDTKTSLARELGVNVTKIKNTEPLKVGTHVEY